jgi:hypothetical protein
MGGALDDANIADTMMLGGNLARQLVFMEFHRWDPAAVRIIGDLAGAVVIVTEGPSDLSFSRLATVGKNRKGGLCSTYRLP